jgi:DNA-binding transcriptional ArsR family regulator
VTLLPVDTHAKLHNHLVVDRLSTSFVALSDPTRRLILERLARGEASVNELAAPFNMSQQAISKHLAYLEKAALIRKRQEGRQRFCVLRPEAFDEIVTWVAHCRAFWEESFDRLVALVSEVKAAEKKRGGKRRARRA